MSKLTIQLVCCDETAAKHSQMIEVILDRSELDERVVETVEQVLTAGEARGLHNAAHHPTHGAVTYLQEVHEGGFTVLFGDPDDLRERLFGPGTWVGFVDDQGPGHASRVGPDGCRRTLRILRGYLPRPATLT